MARSPRLLLLLLAPLLALGAAACGVEAGEEGSSLVVDGGSATTAPAPEGAPPTTDPSTTEPDDEPEEPTLSVPDEAVDQLTDVYTEMGFTEEEAACLADQIAASGGTFDGDPGATMDLINECDIPMSRLMELGEQLGGGDPEVALRESLAAGFRASGLTDEQASCVADAFIEEFGMDSSAAADPSALEGLFAQCDVDPGSFGN